MAETNYIILYSSFRKYIAFSKSITTSQFTNIFSIWIYRFTQVQLTQTKSIIKQILYLQIWRYLLHIETANHENQIQSLHKTTKCYVWAKLKPFDASHEFPIRITSISKNTRNDKWINNYRTERLNRTKKKKKRQRERERRNLKSIDGEKTTENAFLEARPQHDHIVLFIHFDSCKLTI